VPVDEGSARDLRAVAALADEGAQLTGLCALAHSPNARTGADEEAGTIERMSRSGKDERAVAID